MSNVLTIPETREINGIMSLFLGGGDLSASKVFCVVFQKILFAWAKENIFS